MSVADFTETINKYGMIVKRRSIYWEIVSQRELEFNHWMMSNYALLEDKEWQLWHEGGSYCIHRVFDEQMMTMIQLRWL
jgi:hypothetical protein